VGYSTLFTVLSTTGPSGEGGCSIQKFGYMLTRAHPPPQGNGVFVTKFGHRTLLLVSDCDLKAQYYALNDTSLDHKSVLAEVGLDNQSLEKRIISTYFNSLYHVLVVVVA